MTNLLKGITVFGLAALFAMQAFGLANIAKLLKNLQSVNDVSPLLTSNITQGVIRDKSALSGKAQIGWNQVEKILEALPENGNLLVWGLGNDSPFWDGVTTGRVVFLEDGDMSTNLIQGKRWFDLMIEKYPHLEAYAVHYATKNNDATYNRFYSHPENWKHLEMQSLPKDVLETCWDVILVDAPLGCCGLGPARFQSIYMTKVLVNRSMSMCGILIHVFVDDYERKVEHTFSVQVFQASPIEILSRPNGVSNANEQAHFLFEHALPADVGTKNLTDFESNKASKAGAMLVPWNYNYTQGKSSPLSAQGNWIVLLEVNHGYYDFFENWLAHFQALDLKIKVIIMAEDDITMALLEKEVLANYPEQFSGERSSLHLDTKALGYDSTAYKELVSSRAIHILKKLKDGLNVIYCDVDTVWRSSPLLYLGCTDDADIIMQVDSNEFNGISPYYCTGFMAVVSNKRTIQFIEKWQKALDAKPQLNQPVFNDILHKRSLVRHQPLPTAEFPSGNYYFQWFTEREKEKAVIVHNNFIIGHDKKKDRFIQERLWKVD
jgi:hypothetical protein